MADLDWTVRADAPLVSSLENSLEELRPFVSAYDTLELARMPISVLMVNGKPLRELLGRLAEVETQMQVSSQAAADRWRRLHELRREEQELEAAEGHKETAAVLRALSHRDSIFERARD